MSTLKIVLAQLNLHVGNIKYNLQKHIEAANIARDQYQADIIVFSELSLIGYPCEDLLLRPAFLDSADAALDQLRASINGIYFLVGHPIRSSKGLYNGCSLNYNGVVIGEYVKQHLPNYGVFDEERYFKHGKTPCIVNIKDIPVGLLICEDVWYPGPTQRTVMEGAKIILSPNASPFEIDKHKLRFKTLADRAKTNQCAIVYVNQIGGQDDLIFDGGSMVVNEQGEISHFAGFFNENLLPVEINFDSHMPAAEIMLPSDEAKVYEALVLGVHDYVKKNNFANVIVGASGGMDSALTLTIAHDALGADAVSAILMPSRFTAQISIDDAIALANHLDISHEIIPIDHIYEAFLNTMSLSKQHATITEQNIQARIRAVILMALSNQTGKLVLTTGNRSELAVGYCTLYGDMAGAYAPLKDVPKTFVYKLAHYRNQKSLVIPKRTITRAPTAELAENQLDQDTLPPYEILDQILDYYLNDSLSISEIIAKGFEKSLVEKIVTLVRKNEYKRKQSAIGPHIRNKSFGRDWRYPITNGFKG